MFDARLLQDLSPKESEDAKRYLKTNFLVERLREIIRAERAALLVNRKDYDSAGWAYKQAHYNGEYAAFSKLLKILGESEDTQT